MLTSSCSSQHKRTGIRLKGFELLTLVVNNLPFKNGEQVEEEASDRNVA
ncbi:hypothetical protein ACZ87_01157 [Candidatus Erwinia dacicola]|uniref:Uncharacterized protein n=1 Tax=Candidatus Erwinia dacicola TaxID=252393 RepID=A0A328TT67_9GAMM|nr:hypothetical protein ACZ87_01157 [Candidatus Erwinia dacicola]